MSDQPLTQDELASALLDGDVAGPPATDVSDAALAARVDELRAAANAIAAPTPVDDEARERAIAAALAEFDVPVAPATPITPAISARERRIAPALLGAAAAVIVAIGVVAVLNRDDSAPTETAAIAAATTAAGGRAAALAPEAAGAASTTIARFAGGEAADSATQGVAAPAPPIASRDLGEIEDDASLRAALGSPPAVTRLGATAKTPVRRRGQGRRPCRHVAERHRHASLAGTSGVRVRLRPGGAEHAYARRRRGRPLVRGARPGRLSRSSDTLRAMPEPDGHIHIPILEGDWPAQAATGIEQLVTSVRDRTTAPILTIARGIVYALVAGTLILASFILLVVCLIRLLNNYLPGDVWVAYLVLGGVFVLIGLFLWTKRGSASIAAPAAPATSLAPS